MSTTGDRDPTQEGPDGEWIGAAGVGEEMGLDLGPDEGDLVPEAMETEIAGPEFVEILEPEGGPEEEEGAPALVLARAPDGGNEEEDSDIGPAEEGGEDLAENQEILIDARQFPMVGFRFMFLDLVHSLLHRIYYNDHILIRPYRGPVMVRSRSPLPDGSGELPVLHVPQRPNMRGQSQEGQDEGLRLGLDLPEVATSVLEFQEPTDIAEAVQDSVEQTETVAEEAEEMIEQATEIREITKYQYGNWTEEEEHVRGEEEKEAEEEKEKENEEQEGPERDPDPVDGNPENPGICV
ncbi:Cancer/testis antigen 47B [Sciurus carolinensis]|uniref:Cancer/testis antigen 47B n=1 Tax=Sciurus carolinensis TaxID=30640 RepID=A0AA41SWJ5_SCICA|nr:cancer/testis antigen family 47 member A11 [Sciurus carolinensis]MBZ3875565.1 Cancer/testis antigen 47B [Sciurus carolinensis]